MGPVGHLARLLRPFSSFEGAYFPLDRSVHLVALVVVLHAASLWVAASAVAGVVYGETAVDNPARPPAGSCAGGGTFGTPEACLEPKQLGVDRSVRAGSAVRWLAPLAVGGVGVGWLVLGAWLRFASGASRG